MRSDGTRLTPEQDGQRVLKVDMISLSLLFLVDDSDCRC
ncbi:hypothetical protein VITU9109_07259 [Vibrio tubiashii ATCC 19109]|uniref:Uncharacterized protein n=1 Tax=Vibrio tubiashii ATCC 19109 TaxID=1051646 RepID=A0ABP2LQR6_9VIBR|nr:hypothetical protein VITU9109_07259 [Vibrio tubiashii ATCC 19109]